jgi:hypothetical protein
MMPVKKKPVKMKICPEILRTGLNPFITPAKKKDFLK